MRATNKSHSQWQRATHGKRAKSSERKGKGERGAIFNPPNEFHISHSARWLRRGAALLYGSYEKRNATEEGGGRARAGGRAVPLRRVKIGHKEARSSEAHKSSVRQLSGEGRREVKMS